MESLLHRIPLVLDLWGNLDKARIVLRSGLCGCYTASVCLTSS
jgi:hypothetical protein